MRIKENFCLFSQISHTDILKPSKARRSVQTACRTRNFCRRRNHHVKIHFPSFLPESRRRGCCCAGSGRLRRLFQQLYRSQRTGFLRCRKRRIRLRQALRRCRSALCRNRYRGNRQRDAGYRKDGQGKDRYRHPVHHHPQGRCGRSGQASGQPAGRRRAGYHLRHHRTAEGVLRCRRPLSAGRICSSCQLRCTGCFWRQHPVLRRRPDVRPARFQRCVVHLRQYQGL